MSKDDMSDNLNTGHDAENNPPDQASAGDVSTTGHSDHDAQGVHGAGDAHDAHAGGHGGHGADDTSEVSTLVPTSWAQLILPALILLLVAILGAGPIFTPSASKPAAPTGSEQNSTEAPTGAGESPTAAPSATPQSQLPPTL